MGKYSGKKCRLLTMFSLTSTFFLVEIIVGYATNSMALVADSFHMLSDVVALVVAFLAVRVSDRWWTPRAWLECIARAVCTFGRYACGYPMDVDSLDAGRLSRHFCWQFEMS